MKIRVTWVSNSGHTWDKDYRVKSLRNEESGQRLVLVHEGGTETLLYTHWILSVEELA